MKRVLSLALVAVMALGMGVSAFAFDTVDLEKIKDFAPGSTLSDGVRNYTVKNDVVDMGTVDPNGKPELIIDLRTDMFTGTDRTVTKEYGYAVDLAKVRSKFGLLTISGLDSFDDINTAIKDIDTDNKFEEFTLEKIFDSMTDGTVRANALLKKYVDSKLVKTVELTQANLNSEIVFYKDVEADGAPATDAEPVVARTETVGNRNLTSNEIRKSKITLGTTVRAGSQLIKKLSLDNKDGQIVFQTVTEFVSTKSADVEVFMFLRVDGKRLESNGLTVLATLENPVTEVYSNHDYVDLSNGTVAEAIEFNSKVSAYLGNGVTIHTKFFKDKKYYGIAVRDNDQEAERVFNQYKDVDNVLTLKVVGLNNAGDYITLDTDYSGYYVYDKDMNYLGKGDEELKFSSKLYLAYNKLEIEEEEEEEEEIEAPLPTNPENPETGGDGNASNNANMNPGTGC